MAEIKFYANIFSPSGQVLINHSAGSGLGFYGNGFGVSVPINTRQSTTFITDELGSASGERLNNTQAVVLGNPSESTVGTVSVNGASSINLDRLPNYLSPLNIRFTHEEPVATQNCKLRIFDRQDVNNHASGVVTYVYEVRHPSTLESISNLSYTGESSQDDTWFEYDPTESQSPSDMLLTASPGVSGTNTNNQDTNPDLGYLTRDGNQHRSLTHDWYVAISSEPYTVGSKVNYGLYFSLEYV